MQRKVNVLKQIMKKQRYKIKIICAWCQKLIGYKLSKTKGETHGICKSCFEKAIIKIAKGVKVK